MARERPGAYESVRGRLGQFVIAGAEQRMPGCGYVYGASQDQLGIRLRRPGPALDAGPYGAARKPRPSTLSHPRSVEQDFIPILSRMPILPLV